MTYCDYIQDEDIRMQRIETSRPTYAEVRVPKDYVGALIGRGGVTIKDIQEKSNTRITVKRECTYFCGHIW